MPSLLLHARIKIDRAFAGGRDASALEPVASALARLTNPALPRDKPATPGQELAPP